jgi:hypothetical protein
VKRRVRNYDGIYRLVHGKQLADSGDLYPGHDSGCALCRSCVSHSTWSHWALLVGEVSEADVDHFVHTTLGAP